MHELVHLMYRLFAFWHNACVESIQDLAVETDT